MAGPLDGMLVIELTGIGPAPFCGAVLAEWELTWCELIVPRQSMSALPFHQDLISTFATSVRSLWI